jgi:transcriptional regulator with XRE-family HTH domain
MMGLIAARLARDSTQGMVTRAGCTMATDQVESFGQLLRRRRQAAFLTQEALAERAHMSVRAISDLERGVIQSPHNDTVTMLVRALGLSPADRTAFRAAGRRQESPPAGIPTQPAESAAPDASTEPFVFVCYAHSDQSLAARLIADLQARDIACWVETKGLKAGSFDWEQALRDAIRACRAVLLLASRDARLSRFVKAELGVAELYRRPLVPVWVAGEEWVDCVPLSLITVQYIDARAARYAAGLAELVAALGRAEVLADGAGTAAERVPAAPPRNPYKGLRAFGEMDAGDFFGRSGMVGELVEVVRAASATGSEGAARLLAVVGPSGSGKSSLVLAGLLPRLRAGALPGSAGWVYLPPLAPGTHPLEALTVALAGTVDASMRALREHLEADSARGLHLLACRLGMGPEARVLLLIDQFEELFAHGTEEAERQQFVDLLVTAVTEPRGPTLAILTMRADFYHQAMRYPELWRLVERHTTFVAPLSVGWPTPSSARGC